MGRLSLQKSTLVGKVIEEESKFDSLSMISRNDLSAFGPLFDEELGQISIFELNQELQAFEGIGELQTTENPFTSDLSSIVNKRHSDGNPMTERKMLALMSP